MVHDRYLRYIAWGLAGWCALFFAFTWVVDPYGVSPLRLAWAGVNQYKPKRFNIDRQLKPYEVWKLQPRTVFLGTSRIHQSIDPSVLDNTRLGPAYNASIPASSLRMNVDHLREYVNLNPNLRTVVVELFFYNFVNPGPEPAKSAAPLQDFITSAATLFVSKDALWDSILTLAYNLTRSEPAFGIAPRGFQSYRPGHDPSGPFAGYAAGIWKYHERQAGMQLHAVVLDAVDELRRIAKERNLELVFFLTPNHAYDDYYLESVGGWDAVRQWLTKVSAGSTVYSFSQPNDWVYEPVGKGMRYWYDPYHFSVAMGEAMQRAMLDDTSAAMPANFAVRMTPDIVDQHVRERRDAVRRWAERNPQFVSRFHDERRKWEAARQASK